jgi:hypothetical protein
MRDGSRAAAIDTARALVALAQTSLLFHVQGRPAVATATRTIARTRAAASAPSAGQHAAIWRAFRAVQRAIRVWPAEVKCLQTALVLAQVLRARGIDTSLRIGVRKDGGELRAHAWIEAGGFHLDDAPGAGPEFAVLQSLDQRGRLVPL